MKKLIRIVLLLTITFNQTLSFSQQENNNWDVDTVERFNDALCPFGSGLVMWTLKQKYTINAFQVLIDKEIPLDKKYNEDKSRTHIEVFLPVFRYNRFATMLGGSYHKIYTIAEDDSLSQSLQDVCTFWFPIQYTHRNWKFTLLYEQFYRSNKANIYGDIGRTQRFFAMAGYAFNKKWQAIILGAYLVTDMVDEQRTMIVPAVQLRYQPSERFKMTFGAPVLYAMEWQMNDYFDLYASQLMLDETDIFLRYNISNRFGLTAHFKSTSRSMSDTYFPNKNSIINNVPISYNKMLQFQNTVSLKLGIKTFDNLAFFLTGGYNMGNKIKLYNNETELTSVNGDNEFYIGLSVQLLKYL